MWVFFAKAGFFSVIQSAESDEHLVVRARVRADLVRLRRLYAPQLGQIQSTPTRDYSHRATVRKADFASALVRAVSDIDFVNFKNEVAVRLGVERAHVYGQVWAALLELQHGPHL